MYCRKCGRQLDDTWKTCPYCGEPVYAEQVGKEFLPETKNTGTAFYKKWWFWVIIAAVIVVIGVISVLALYLNSEEKTEPEIQVVEEKTDFSNQDFKELIGKTAEDVERAGMVRSVDPDEYTALDGSLKIIMDNGVVDQISISGQPETAPAFYSVKIGMDEEKAARNLEEFYPEDTSTDDMIKLSDFDTKGSVKCDLSEGNISEIRYMTLTDEEIAEINAEKEEKMRAEYIFPDSDKKYLSKNEIKSVDLEELALARNEIFARHGYIFTDETYREYFESKSWYQGTIAAAQFNPDKEFNNFEKRNVELIQQVEDELNETSTDFIGREGSYVCTDPDLFVTGRIDIIRKGNSFDFCLGTLEMDFDLLTGSAELIDSSTIQLTSYGITYTCTWSDSEHMYVTCSEVYQGMDGATLDATTNGRNYVYSKEFN